MKAKKNLTVLTKFEHLKVDVASPAGRTPKVQKIFEWKETVVSVDTYVVDMARINDGKVNGKAEDDIDRTSLSRNSVFFAAGILFGMILLTPILSVNLVLRLAFALLSVAALLSLYVTKSTDNKAAKPFSRGEKWKVLFPLAQTSNKLEMTAEV